MGGSGSQAFFSNAVIETNYLNVTTAWSVVLLPSSQPFGKIPGDPQLISKIQIQIHHCDIKITQIDL